MVNRTLIRDLENDPDIQSTYDLEVEGFTDEGMDPTGSNQSFDVNKIVVGRILRVADGMVMIDIGFKSEGSISLNEWDEGEEPPQVGQLVRVLIEDLEDEQAQLDDSGMVRISKRKAAKQDQWEDMMKRVKEGDIVTGVATRKIKGGLLVDITGVNVFLPASQVDIRRPSDIGDYIGRTVQCEVLKIDAARRNIVVSRRSLIEKQRETDRETLLSGLTIGDVRKGVVKNIAEFGAFVDLGGIDGLLHITDMSWERIGHPTEMVAIDQELEVKVLHIDREKKKIALGLKQLLSNPWENVVDKYPVGTVVKGSVVNVMSYGAFVKLEPGIEGLVHISEMSWTRRVNHPSELVNIGDEISVVILGVDREGQQLSLGMKQTQENPWTRVADKYPVDALVEGKVRNLTNYGAFIELEEGIDGLLHVSDMSWTRKISHPSEMLEKGQAVKCKILSVDQERRRIALGLKQLDEDPWAANIPGKYAPGQVVTGTVTKITNFGVFVGLEDGLEGLLHISELADHKVENPEDVVKVGDKIEVKVLRVDIDERKIGLSRKRVEWSADANAAADAAEAAAAPPPPKEKKQRGELKGGLGGSGPLIAPAPAPAAEKEPTPATEKEDEKAESPAE